jgi:hypothetical protein
MKSLKLFSLLTITALVMGINAYAATLDIDPFDASQGPLTANSGATEVSGTVDDASILGGERDVVVHYTAGPLNVEVNVNPGGNSLYTHSQDASTTGASWIIWDGNDNDPLTLDPTGLGGVDLTLGGLLTGILLDVDDNDLGNPDALRIEIYTDGGNWSFAETGLPPGPSLFFLDFLADFGVGAGAGADFTNVGAIALHVNGTTEPAQDLSFDLVSASDNPVPEPSTVILLGIGVVGLALGARRRKSA